MANRRNYGTARFRQSSVVSPPTSPRYFWDLLVAYANTDLRTPSSWQEWEKAVWQSAVPSSSYKSPFERIAHLLLSSDIVYGLPYIDAKADLKEWREHPFSEDREDKILATAAKELRKHHRIFRNVLKWICARKVPCDIRTMKGSAKSAARGKPTQWGRYPTISAADERFVAYLERHGVLSSTRRLFLISGRLVSYPKRWASAIDPFCAFLVEQCAGRTHRDIPVRVCARPMCRRFFVFTRNTGKFCKASCRASNYWTRGKRKEYMREYRLKKLPPGVRRNKAASGTATSRRAGPDGSENR